MRRKDVGGDEAESVMTVHRHSAKRAGWTAALMCLMASTPLWAQPQGCRDFAWDVHQERTLFAGQPNHVQGGTSAESSPRVETDHLYQVALVPQSQVRYVTPPGKARSADGAYGGMVRFRVPRTGSYRVALDAAFWVDVVADGKLLESEDFSGQHGLRQPTQDRGVPDVSGARSVVADQ